MTQVWVYPIIGNAWGSPTIDQQKEGEAASGPEHKWIAHSTNWVALCDQENIKTPPLDFYKHLPQLGLWSEPNRNIADACEACREINDDGVITQMVGERPAKIMPGMDADFLTRFPPLADDQKSFPGLG